MKYTLKPPSEPGWYFTKSTRSGYVYVRKVYEVPGMEELICDARNIHGAVKAVQVDKWEVMWAGPIPEPEGVKP